MATVLHILGILLLFTACLLALFSLVIGVPGTFIIVAVAFIYAWATGFAAVHWSTLGWLLLLAVIGEGIEFLAASVAASGTRPSRRVTIGALVGALIGGIVGTPILFGIGSLLGALAGAFLGAALAVQSEGGSLRESVATGFAALKGRLLGFVVKAALGAAMVIIVVVAAL
jgi:uncharacterized protein YqgC (DUF456 family)